MTRDVLHLTDMERDAVLNLRVPADVKEALRRAAEADHGRSISGMAVRVFREWLGAHGYLALDAAENGSPRRRKR
jgi:hypothetical protein